MKENSVPFDAKGIGTRIEEACDRVGGKRNLSNMTGISEATLYRMIEGGSQKLESMCAISEASGLTLNYLVYGANGSDNEPETSDIEADFALIPGYSVQVAAGSGAFPSNEEPCRRLAFRHKWLRYRGLKEKDLVLVFAKGDSMEPTICDNDTLMIDTSQRDLTDGAIYVIRVNSHLVVKRVQTLLNRDIMLLSDNKEYHPETLKPEQLADLEVIGRVVWVGKDI